MVRNKSYKASGDVDGGRFSVPGVLSGMVIDCNLCVSHRFASILFPPPLCLLQRCIIRSVPGSSVDRGKLARL